MVHREIYPVVKGAVVELGDGIPPASLGKLWFIQWEFQDPKMEVPTIYKAYFLGLCKGIYPPNMAFYGTNVPPFKDPGIPIDLLALPQLPSDHACKIQRYRARRSQSNYSR